MRHKKNFPRGSTSSYNSSKNYILDKPFRRICRITFVPSKHSMQFSWLDSLWWNLTSHFKFSIWLERSYFSGFILEFNIVLLVVDDILVDSEAAMTSSISIFDNLVFRGAHRGRFCVGVEMSVLCCMVCLQKKCHLFQRALMFF